MSSPAFASSRGAELERLRLLVGRTARPLAVAHAATGIAALDRALGGGLPRRRLTELVGRRSSGRTSLALAALAAATRRGEAAALVDVAGMLDARSAERAGIVLERLLWVEAGDAQRGLRAADLVLGAGGFGLVVLDLGEGLPRVPDAAWLRLARGAERGAQPGTALVVVATARVAGSFAALGLEARGLRPDLVRGDGPCVLRGLDAEVAVARSRVGAPGETARVCWVLR